MRHFRLLLPFSAIAAAFILLGIILNDVFQVYSGTLCLFIAFIYVLTEKFRHHKT